MSCRVTIWNTRRNPVAGMSAFRRGLKLAVYRLPALPLAAVEFGQLALEVEILPELQRRPLLALAFALLPAAAPAPMPAQYRLLLSQHVGFRRSHDAAASASAADPRVLEAEIFDSHNVGLAFGGKLGIQVWSTNALIFSAFDSFGPVFSARPTPGVFSPRPLAVMRRVVNMMWQ